MYKKFFHPSNGVELGLIPAGVLMLQFDKLTRLKTEDGVFYFNNKILTNPNPTETAPAEFYATITEESYFFLEILDGLVKIEVISPLTAVNIANASDRMVNDWITLTNQRALEILKNTQ